jgi:hypothetical protein
MSGAVWVTDQLEVAGWCARPHRASRRVFVKRIAASGMSEAVSAGRPETGPCRERTNEALTSLNRLLGVPTLDSAYRMYLRSGSSVFVHRNPNIDLYVYVGTAVHCFVRSPQCARRSFNVSEDTRHRQPPTTKRGSVGAPRHSGQGPQSPRRAGGGPSGHS